MKPTSALLIMSGERRTRVLEKLEACGVHVSVACSIQEARTVLGTRPVPVIFTGTSLPDGNWRDVLTHRTEAGLKSAVIVYAERLERGLCSDAFALGAWDVITDSSTSEEVCKTIQTALSSAYMQSLRPAVRAAGSSEGAL